MPPLTPSCEMMDAKAWATATMEAILPETKPISFEPPASPWAPLPFNRDATSPRRRPPPKGVFGENPVRRSFSVLEHHVFRTGSSSSSSISSSNTSSQHTCAVDGSHHKPKSGKAKRYFTRPQTAFFSFHPLEGADRPVYKAYSAPTTPTSEDGQSRGSFSSRFRRSLSIDRTMVKQLFTSPPELFARQAKTHAQREKEGLAMWERAFQTSLANDADIMKQQNAPSARSVQIARFVKLELLSTEETYLSHLITFKTCFIDPRMHDQQRPLLTMHDLEPLFTLMPQLIMVSTTLVHSLQRKRDVDDAGASIGQVFCDLEGMFSVFVLYAAHYDRLQRCLAKSNRDVGYRLLSHRLDISDYLIAPIQRITRYCLLLKDLKKYSGPDAQLDRALKCLNALALAMNDIQK